MKMKTFFGTILLAFLLLYSTASSGEEFSLEIPDFRAAKMAQNGDSAFPADSAGIAAYVGLEQAIDLEVIKPLFDEVKEVQENFIWGMIEVSNFGGNSQVHLYVDTDGWLVAFLKHNEPTAGMMQWLPADKNTPVISAISRTTLTDVLREVAVAIQVDFLSQIRYGHFKYPEATGMKLFVKVTPTKSTTNFTKVIIPQPYTLYEKSYYHYAYHATPTHLKVDDLLVSELSTGYDRWLTAIKFYDGVISNGIFTLKDVFTKGELHTISISYIANDGRDYGSAGVATALVYRAGE
ncbi:MAG: hypothetical protein HOC74_21720 [Gemmatimonadetes bacterium]|jgi:hypothetical protein|nr:hypothetical protein [Gemmatimonadota bacterium]